MVVALVATALNLRTCLRANMRKKLFGVDEVDKHELSPQAERPTLYLAWRTILSPYSGPPSLEMAMTNYPQDYPQRVSPLNKLSVPLLNVFLGSEI